MTASQTTFSKYKPFKCSLSDNLRIPTRFHVEVILTRVLSRLSQGIKQHDDSNESVYLQDEMTASTNSETLRKQSTHRMFASKLQRLRQIRPGRLLKKKSCPSLLEANNASNIIDDEQSELFLACLIALSTLLRRHIEYWRVYKSSTRRLACTCAIRS